MADLETNQPNKILKTNLKGELEFSDASDLQTENYNALDCTSEGKALDARQGKVLKEMIDNCNVLPTDIINDYTSKIVPNKAILDTLYPDIPVGTFIHFTKIQSNPNFPATYKKTTFGWILIGYTQIIQ